LNTPGTSHLKIAVILCAVDKHTLEPVMQHSSF